MRIIIKILMLGIKTVMSTIQLLPKITLTVLSVASKFAQKCISVTKPNLWQLWVLSPMVLKLVPLFFLTIGLTHQIKFSPILNKLHKQLFQRLSLLVQTMLSMVVTRKQLVQIQIQQIQLIQVDRRRVCFKILKMKILLPKLLQSLISVLFRQLLRRMPSHSALQLLVSIVNKTMAAVHTLALVLVSMVTVNVLMTAGNSIQMN